MARTAGDRTKQIVKTYIFFVNFRSVSAWAVMFLTYNCMRLIGSKLVTCSNAIVPDIAVIGGVLPSSKIMNVEYPSVSCSLRETRTVAFHLNSMFANPLSQEKDCSCLCQT